MAFLWEKIRQSLKEYTKKSKYVTGVVLFLIALVAVYIGIWFRRALILKDSSLPELSRLIRKSAYLKEKITCISSLDVNWIHLDQLSDTMVLLLLTSEDRRFYEHHGVDFFRILKILFTPNISGTEKPGGSTLTQQLIKTIWGSCDRTIWFKLHEMAGVWIVEWLLSKDEILELYINCVMWSPNSVGLASAGRELFGKEVEELRPDDMILLVAGLPNPEALAEFIKRSKQNRRLLNRIQRLKSEAVSMGISLESRKGNVYE